MVYDVTPRRPESGPVIDDELVDKLVDELSQDGVVK
jgi:hypothetical protein